MKKWGMEINFFEKFYLNSGIDKDKNLIVNKYEGELSEPKKNPGYYFAHIKCKLLIFYLFLIRFKY